MKGKQKILLLVCSVIAVVSVSCMAAYALLKTVTETKTNVFASDKSISIDLTEPQWERYGKEAAKVYVPGQTIDKDPTVSLNDESISAYVALKVQFFDEKNNELTFREFADRYLYGGSELANAGIDWSKDWTFIGNANSDLENDEYTIYNNYSVEQKLKVMDKTLVAGPVAYIGDCDKDIALLQKASVAISRGGVHNEKVQRNSDIMLTDSNFDTIIDLLKIARKQKSINIGNTFIGIVISLLVVLLAVISFIPWWVACLIYILESILVLLNSQNIVRM